ncbi:unnamed protein product, partial [Ectocarpus sp. 8 AP-2014]
LLRVCICDFVPHGASRHLKRRAFLRKGPFRQAQLAQRNIWRVFSAVIFRHLLSLPAGFLSVYSSHVTSVRSARTQKPGHIYPRPLPAQNTTRLEKDETTRNVVIGPPPQKGEG